MSPRSNHSSLDQMNNSAHRRRSIMDLYANKKPQEKIEKKPSKKPLIVFFIFLILDTVATVYYLVPVPTDENHTEQRKFYFYNTHLDFFVVSIIRILSATISIAISYVQAKPPPPSTLNLYHPNGDRKSNSELEEEALEEPFKLWMKRYFSRYAFPCEFVSVISVILAMVKCLIRLDVEVAVNEDKISHHFLWWLAAILITFFSSIDIIFLDTVVKRAGKYGRHAKKKSQRRTVSGISLSELHRDPDNNLLSPLIDYENNIDLENTVYTSSDSESDNESYKESFDESDDIDDENIRGASDIGADADYKATLSDLMSLVREDTCHIIVAFIFLLGAATAQVYIPQYTGNILDCLTENANKNDDDSSGSGNIIWNIPGFVSNTKKLVAAAILCGVFSGLRGAMFTLVGGRVNCRLRTLLMDSLLSQDIGFFDTTKTGDITSRLSSDTTLVGDQVTLNINVFLRSLVQALGVLIFMFMISWQLSLLAFISVPMIVFMSKWYGNYIRKLTKLMQKKLADGNAISEAALSAMPTVRAFAAENAELEEYKAFMQKYLALNLKNAISYFGYATAVTSLPQLVTALVLFYGGILVQSEGNDHITAGQLVSFLLYLTSLSDAFNSIGSIFASLTQAVGAADKVFELIYREPRILHSTLGGHSNILAREVNGGDTSTISTRSRCLRTNGLKPPDCHGEVTLTNVEMYYPARPNRRILDFMSLRAPPGAVVALVGPSGGGKSSIISLIQHLYEPTNGRICIDGNDIHELSPEWLSRHVCVVSQEPTLFARSVYRNIIYGLEGTDLEPSLEEIKVAARLANAHDFIESLPGGYDSDVGERGVQLSGGQKQRVAIARALVRKPRILLLDEATSALDAESEASVQEAIDGMLMRGRDENTLNDGDSSSMTVIVVAHRLSTIRNADIILVLEKGRVIEQGCHDDLVKNERGPYSNLVQRQMKAQNKLEKS